MRAAHLAALGAVGGGIEETAGGDLAPEPTAAAATTAGCPAGRQEDRTEIRDGENIAVTD